MVCVVNVDELDWLVDEDGAPGALDVIAKYTPTPATTTTTTTATAAVVLTALRPLRRCLGFCLDNRPSRLNLPK